MGEMACPTCGNPQLDVDEQNSVVFCKRCGFAVQVDPQTGQTNTLNPGNAGGAAPAGVEAQGAPAAYSSGSIFGMDPLTFWMLGAAALLVLYFVQIIKDITTLFILAIILTIFWWMKR